MQPEFVVTIDSHQLKKAIHECHSIYDELAILFKSYKHHPDVYFSVKDSYYFKIFDRNTNNGLQICVSPKTMKLDIYIIKNKKKYIHNINNYNIINNSQDIFNYFKRIIHYTHTIDERLSFVHKFFVDKMYMCTKFKITKRNNIIDIVDNDTQNGLYIFFDTMSFANIGTINNSEYFNVNATSVSSVDELYDTIYRMINHKYHNVNYFHVIDTKYLDCDMSEYQNQDTIQTSDVEELCDPKNYLV